MDDKAALIARRVAMSAAAWFNAPRMLRPIAGSPRRPVSGTPTAPDDGVTDGRRLRVARRAGRRRAAAVPCRAAARRDRASCCGGPAASSSAARTVAVRAGPLPACYTAALCNGTYVRAFGSGARGHSGARPHRFAAGRWQLAGFVLLASAKQVPTRVRC